MRIRGRVLGRLTDWLACQYLVGWAFLFSFVHAERKKKVVCYHARFKVSQEWFCFVLPSLLPTYGLARMGFELEHYVLYLTDAFAIFCCLRISVLLFFVEYEVPYRSSRKPSENEYSPMSLIGGPSR